MSPYLICSLIINKITADVNSFLYFLCITLNKKAAAASAAAAKVDLRLFGDSALLGNKSCAEDDDCRNCRNRNICRNVTGGGGRTAAGRNGGCERYFVAVESKGAGTDGGVCLCYEVGIQLAAGDRLDGFGTFEVLTKGGTQLDNACCIGFRCCP